MVLLYMVTFAINIPPMLAYIPSMDPMGSELFFSRDVQNYADLGSIGGRLNG